MTNLVHNFTASVYADRIRFRVTLTQEVNANVSRIKIYSTDSASLDESTIVERASFPTGTEGITSSVDNLITTTNVPNQENNERFSVINEFERVNLISYNFEYIFTTGADTTRPALTDSFSYWTSATIEVIGTEEIESRFSPFLKLKAFVIPPVNFSFTAPTTAELSTNYINRLTNEFKGLEIFPGEDLHSLIVDPVSVFFRNLHVRLELFDKLRSITTLIELDDPSDEGISNPENSRKK